MFRSAVLTAVAIVSLGAPDAHAQGFADAPFSNRVKIPEFPEGLKWLNVPQPIAMQQLRGKFVLLDFWTYCCINCMHILPELKKLEQTYPNELVVIGVHSAKFAGEQDAKNIEEAIQRYEIHHPVISDPQHALWTRFGVNVWPTVLLIDPEGYAVWGRTGEVTYEQLNKVLKPAVAFYGRKRLLDRRPLVLDRPATPDTPLRFPGKVLADEASSRLFIADSNHNRIVIARLDGTLIDTVGRGTQGNRDGDYATAEFNHPQGMALRGQTLYVADTENHLLRKVDLAARKVTTLAGVGQQARKPAAPGRLTRALATPLNSPWDLCLHKDTLYIAMAGPHQIWHMPLRGTEIGPYAGNGREDIVDGPLQPREPYEQGFCSFAQPSGLASDGTWLYVADSEGSSIRSVPLPPGRQVRTLVGTSHLPQGRLFTFGDVDGPAQTALFQHPLGVAFYDGQLYVADTYNNKIRVVNPADGTTKTLAGTGKPGNADGEAATFDEPAGISAAAGRLFVADTNSHAIRVIDLKAGARVSTLTITGLKPLK
jgi:sugar lactone lactonase YvrE/thiol-disulfide isomerase/thioredoxin